MGSLISVLRLPIYIFSHNVTLMLLLSCKRKLFPEEDLLRGNYWWSPSAGSPLGLLPVVTGHCPVICCPWQLAAVLLVWLLPLQSPASKRFATFGTQCRWTNSDLTTTHLTPLTCVTSQSLAERCVGVAG